MGTSSDEAPPPAMRAPGPAHRSPRLVGAVALGGLVGTAARVAVGQALPHEPGAWPVGTLVVNVVGAFALGLLLEALARAGADVGGRRLVRLGVGTGLIGSFTTYGALAVETERLLAGGAVGTGVAYALVSVVAGLLAAAAGIAVAGHPGRRRRGRAVDPDGVA